MDKLYKRVYSVPGRHIPENVLGKLMRAVSNEKYENMLSTINCKNLSL